MKLIRKGQYWQSDTWTQDRVPGFLIGLTHIFYYRFDTKKKIWAYTKTKHDYAYRTVPEAYAKEVHSMFSLLTPMETDERFI